MSIRAFPARAAVAVLAWLIAGPLVACPAPPPPDSAAAADTIRPAETMDSLNVVLEAPEVAAPGAPVPIVIRVENQSGRRLTLSLRGREPILDLVISRDDGTVVWQRLEGEAIPAILRLEELEPGADLVLQATWDQRDGRGRPVPPGRYRLEGSVLTDGEPIRAPARDLRIE